MKYLLSRLLVPIALIPLVFVACGTGTTATTYSIARQRSTPASMVSARDQEACSTRQVRWSPVGVKWKLTVRFLVGSRSGQSETSYMTFLPSGDLTATFPGATPGAPDALPPATDGRWCATGATTFSYVFRDPLVQHGTMVAYIQTAITARMTSARTYTAQGVGVGYAAAINMPLEGLYNVTQTTAIAV